MYTVTLPVFVDVEPFVIIDITINNIKTQFDHRIFNEKIPNTHTHTHAHMQT